MAKRKKNKKLTKISTARWNHLMSIFYKFLDDEKISIYEFIAVSETIKWKGLASVHIRQNPPTPSTIVKETTTTDRMFA